MMRPQLVVLSAAGLLCSLTMATVGAVAAEAVDDQSAAKPAAVAALADGEHRALVQQVCGQCHPIERVVAQRRSATEWDDMIAKMVQRGAKATELEQDRIYQYLVTRYGPSAP